MELLKEIFTLQRHPTSSSAEADFLNLSYEDMRSIKALVTGGNLLNERQCRDLSRKLSKTVGSIEELVVHCGGSTDRFRPAMENLYRILEKARLLVDKCCKGNWITEAVFQIENAQDFQVLLLDVGLCYHAIYEQAKDMSDARTFEHEDLRKSSTFRPAPISEVREDQDALKRRLEVLASSQRNNLKPSGEHLQQYALARYLLVRWESMSQQSQTNELNLSNVISCTMGIESTDPWGNDRYLGHGAFGGVCGSKWLGIPCAKKVLDGGVNECSFLKEAGILFHLNHPHVVKFFCCGYRQEEGDFFIAMELMQMNLAKLISIRCERKIPLSYPVTIEILVQIARAMCYLHGMGVAHRDLKPQNVVVNKLTSPHLPDQYCVKLVDFGLSKVKVEASKSNSVTGPGIGTTRYRAPEAHPRGPGRVNWFKADAYSFGVTGAHLLSLEEPFENMNLGNKYAELMTGEMKPEVPATCPEKLVGLLNRCWDTRPSSRPKFTEILMQLEEIRYAVLRGLLPRNRNGIEVDIEFTRIEVEDEFIRIMVEEHCATRRQHIVSTDEVIELKPSLGSVMTSGKENMACKNLDTIMPDSSFARDVSNLHWSASGESLSSINGDTTMLDSASARDVSVYHSTAFVEPLSSIDEVADAASGSAERAPTLERSEYVSAPDQSMMQSRGNFLDKVELALVASMPHWSEVSSHGLAEEGKQQSGFGDENKRGDGGKAAVPVKVAAGIGARNTRAAQATNRRALGDIGNLVGAMSVRCNVKEGVVEPIAKQAVVQPEAITRPITRRFGTNLQNNQVAARVPLPAASVQAEVSKAELKAAEDVATWGATKRRKTLPKPRETSTVSSESHVESADSQAVSTNSNVITYQTGNPARLKAHSRSKVVKKEKEQTLTATLTERSEIARRVYDADMHDAEEPVPNIDEHDTDNQLAVVEYIEDIYGFYRKTEIQSCVPADYMSRQSDINEKMRAILIDWLIEVHLKFKLMPETLFLTTNLIDRYLCVQSVSRKNLQLVGVTAMLLAAKYEEIWAPKVNDIVRISENAYTRDEVLTMEKNMLNTLKFNLTVPTPYVFIVRFLKAAASDKQEKIVASQLEMVAWFLVELCLTEYPMIKYAPSLLAAAAVYTAEITVARTPRWGPALQKHSGYSEAQIKECAALMAILHSKAGDGNLTVVHKKYSLAKLLGVAKLPHATSLCAAQSDS